MLDTACAASKSRPSDSTCSRMALSVSTSVGWWSVMEPIVRALTHSFGSIRSGGNPASILTRSEPMLAVDAQAMEAAQATLTEQEVDVVRLAYSDLIGAERGRDL